MWNQDDIIAPVSANDSRIGIGEKIAHLELGWLTQHKIQYSEKCKGTREYLTSLRTEKRW